MRVAAAWSVHLFTASGVVLALLALEATYRGEWRLALLWLLAALAVDGVDGSLARMARVKEVVPRIDGEAFDLIVDYLNYVFVPAVFIARSGLVPPPLASSQVYVVSIGNGPSSVLITNRSPGTSSRTS